jgi:rhamnulokinase
MEIPRRVFSPVIPPGTRLGPLRATIAAETGARTTQVFAPVCHDTGSAVVAVPAARSGFAWISSGTWSIMGVELKAPIINAASLAFNFTNEGGVNNSFRFSKNIAGMWFVQECRRAWALEGETLSYDEITQLAAAARPFRSIIDPDAPDFFGTGNMPVLLRAYCQRTGQAVPESKGEVVRCALEGIACKYRWVLEHMEEILGYRLEVIHIVGGGSRNQLLNQFTADATGRTVITGPVEATAIGNLLVQAIAAGELGSLPEARSVVRQSFPVRVVEPQNGAGWHEAYARLGNVMAQPG